MPRFFSARYKQPKTKTKTSGTRKKLMNGVIGCLLLCAVVSYLIQANGMVTKGYQIKELEQQLQGLNQVRKNLESQSLELQSMASLTQRLEKLNMVKVDAAKYLAPQDSTALNR